MNRGDIGIVMMLISLNSLLCSLALTFIYHGIGYKGQAKTMKNFGIPLVCSYTIFFIILGMGVLS